MDFKNFEDKLVSNCATKHKTAVNTSLFMQEILKKIGIFLLDWFIPVFFIASIIQLVIDVFANCVIFMIYSRNHKSLYFAFPTTPKNNWVVNMSSNAWKSVHLWLYFSLYMDVVILVVILSITIIVAIISALVYFLFIVPQKADKYINDKDS
ncbi:MAG: hypothetical protein ACYCTB_11895 [bacterium]